MPNKIKVISTTKIGEFEKQVNELLATGFLIINTKVVVVGYDIVYVAILESMKD
jgi:hypothetical protein